MAKLKPNPDPAAKAMVEKRLQKLTPERRKEIARKAAQARWGKKKRKK